MSTYARFPRVWHVGETANPFEVQMVLDDGVSAREGILGCTFKMVNYDYPSIVLIGPVACDVLDSGVCSYTPTVEQMTVDATLDKPMRFLAQYVATLADGSVLPTVCVMGFIEANI